MSKYDANAFGSLSQHSHLATLFRSQLELLDELLEKPLSKGCQHVTPLLGAIQGNCKALLILERDGLLNELALIQRIFVQRIINCCYLLNAEQQVIVLCVLIQVIALIMKFVTVIVSAFVLLVTNV